MNKGSEKLIPWLHLVVDMIEKELPIEPPYFISFLKEPSLTLQLVDILDELPDDPEHETFYSACIFGIDIAIVQLHSAQEAGHHRAKSQLDELMDYLAQTMYKENHMLSFWLPILNAFYDLQIPLSNKLRAAYLTLVDASDEPITEEPEEHLDVIHSMLDELSDLSAFDIADNFFAQSYAMPVDFFSDLFLSLYHLDEGKEIALLLLIHPDPTVRKDISALFNTIVYQLKLSSLSLSRLALIKSWYPKILHDQFNEWIKHQRRQQVVLSKPSPWTICDIKATEVDGSGAQGVFIHIKHKRTHRICGLLFKYDIGIKDVWITPEMKSSDIKQYYQDAFDDNVTLREVDISYVLAMGGHFFATMLEKNDVPGLHLLEIEELTGLYLVPDRLDIDTLIHQLEIEIIPFTPSEIETSFKRSKAWLYSKAFTESWFIENTEVDKWVTRYSSIINGTKVCAIEDALEAVFTEVMEKMREKWLFHFLWMALWAKSGAKKNEKMWQDNFIIAHAIHSGTPLKMIPVLYEIGHQTVLNSIETMEERRTYLYRE